MKQIILFLVCVWTVLASQAWASEPLPGNVRALLQNVRTAMDKSDYAGAIALIRKAQAKGGEQTGPCDHPLVCLALGNCHLMTQAYGPAESAYTKALSLDPAFLDARINLAKVYADSNRYGKASREFHAAYSQSDPKIPDYLYYAAAMALMDGKAGDAASLFEQLFATHPEKVTRQWKESFSQALITAQLWKKAVPLVRGLAEQSQGEEQVKWQETLLQIYLTMGDTTRALDWARHLARQAPQVSQWWKALVHIHLSQGNYTQALDNLIILGFAAPLSREEKKLLADLCLQLEIPARAAPAYEDLLGRSADPKTEKGIIQNLIHALRQLGRCESALALLDRFDPSSLDTELLLLKGDLLYETRDFKAANAVYCLAARRESSKKGQAWLMAGYAAWQHNDLAASRSAFEKAAQFKGLRKDALAAMAQIKKTSPM